MLAKNMSMDFVYVVEEFLYNDTKLPTGSNVL
jgi:hypothetical protein